MFFDSETVLVLIKFALPQAAYLGIHFLGKTVMLHILEGPVKGHIPEDGRRRKGQHLAGV